MAGSVGIEPPSLPSSIMTLQNRLADFLSINPFATWKRRIICMIALFLLALPFVWPSSAQSAAPTARMYCLPGGNVIMMVNEWSVSSEIAASVAHEEIHAEQCREMGFWRFYRTHFGGVGGMLTLETPAYCAGKLVRWERSEEILHERAARNTNVGPEAFARLGALGVDGPRDRHQFVQEVVSDLSGNLPRGMTPEEVVALGLPGRVREACAETLRTLPE